MGLISLQNLFGLGGASTPSAEPVATTAVLPPVERRTVIAQMELPTHRGLWQSTIRAMTQAAIVGQGDGNDIFGRAIKENSKLAGEPLSAALRELGRPTDDDERNASKIAASVPFCEFASEMDVPRSFYVKNPTVKDLCQSMHCIVLCGMETEQFAACVIAAFNPIAATIVAEYLRSTTFPAGFHPYVSAMRISMAAWTDAKTKHFQ